MARSHNIYHLYCRGKRIRSATVKHEIMHFIKEKNLFGPDYSFTRSPDNGDGEQEVPGWRDMPRQDEPIVNDNDEVVSYVEKVVSEPSANGNYRVLNREGTRLTVYFARTREVFKNDSMINENVWRLKLSFKIKNSS